MAEDPAPDPARTLARLWGEEAGTAARRRGPAPRHSLAEVVAAAIALADAEGLDALSMRRVGAALGVAPMTLYTHVAGRAELLDLMLDAIYREMPRRKWTARQGWRARVRRVADDNLALVREHPWANGLGATRPPLGPGLMAKYEHELAAFDGTPLDDVQIDGALTFVLGFAGAAARAEQAASAAVAASGTDDAAWWATAGPLLARVLDAERYPRAVRIGEAAGAAQGSAADPATGYAFGLERVLDGLAALIEAPPRGAETR